MNSKFKIGDKVRVIGNEGDEKFYNIGDVGEVTGFNMSGAYIFFAYQNANWLVDCENMELLKDFEWKSAFEIEGFLSGETTVVDKSGSKFKIYDGLVHEVLDDGTYIVNYNSFNYFMRNRLKKEEDKKIKYIHEYWGVHGLYYKVKSDKPWESYSKSEQTHINTEEIEE